jgi:hypothetical protein
MIWLQPGEPKLHKHQTFTRKMSSPHSRGQRITPSQVLSITPHCSNTARQAVMVRALGNSPAQRR